MIRVAKPDDYKTIIKKGKHFYDFAGLSTKGLGYHPGRFLAYIENIAKFEHVIIFVAEHRSEFVGSIAGILSPWYLDTSQTIILEHWFWVDPEYRGKGYDLKLLKALLEWGKSRNAHFCILIALDGVNDIAIDRYYSKQGFKPLETYHIKEI